MINLKEHYSTKHEAIVEGFMTAMTQVKRDDQTYISEFGEGKHLLNSHINVINLKECGPNNNVFVVPKTSKAKALKK